MTKLEKVATRHNCNFMGGVAFCTSAREQFAENAKKANMFVKGWLCYISIIKCLVSDTQDLLQTKLKFWPLSNFE